MTEREQAERLAHKIIDQDSPPWNIKMAIIEGALAGRDSMRAELDSITADRDGWKDAKIEQQREKNEAIYLWSCERERSQKLIDGLLKFGSHDKDCPAPLNEDYGVICTCGFSELIGSDK